MSGPVHVIAPDAIQPVGVGPIIYPSPFGPITPPRMTLTDYVMEGLRSRGNAPAITDGITGQSLSGSDLIWQIRSLAGGLVAGGMTTGATVAVIAANAPDFAVIVHGALYAGARVVLISPAATQDEISHQATCTRARLVVADPGILPRLGHVQVPVLTTARGGPSGFDTLMGPPLDRQPDCDPAHTVAVIAYSSGTTGLPKGVMLTHANLVASLAQSRAVRPLAPGETTVAVLPFSHVYGFQLHMNQYLSQGASVVTLPRLDMDHMLRLADTQRVARLFLIPPIIAALARYPRLSDHDLSALRMISTGAANLTPGIAAACTARLGVPVLQNYGMTELGPSCSVTSPDDQRPGSSGRTLPGTDARIVDPGTGQDALRGGQGELWIRGPQVMPGYLDDADATAAARDSEGWLHTGDIARIDPDGHVHITDRMNDCFKFNGMQISPSAIESVLLTHPDIADAAVIGQPHPSAGKIPVAFVVPNAGHVPAPDAIIDFVAARVAVHQQIREVTVVEAIPRSPSGKILRRLLRANP
jgi:acyl-CoA synthetase (AMP-forming)/AMP-acid ligase II